MKISLYIFFFYFLFFKNHPKCLKNVHLIPGLSAGERDTFPLRELEVLKPKAAIT